MSWIRSRATALAALFAVLAPAAASAQSLLSAGGLGTPIDPLDARARALGGVSIGLTGGQLLPTDPVAAADLAVPSVTITFANAWVDVEEGDVTSTASGGRFPALGVSYPVKSWGTATLTYGSVLDQRWETTREQRLPLGGGLARVTDRFLSDGGIAALRLGFASRIAPSLAVGGSIGRYTGELTRNLTRTFDSVDVSLDVSQTQAGGFWNYSGVTATVGATVDVAQVLRVAANLTWSGDVDADPSEDTSGSGATFDFPLELRVGVSGALTPALVANVGVMHADWSSAGEPLRESSGRSALTVGGGLEWTGATLAGRRSPVRLGYRRSTLPFTLGTDEAVETAFTAGVGIDFVQSGNTTIAGMGIALERGSREAGTLSERFLRASLTLRVAGF
jgi:hypothetical protein